MLYLCISIFFFFSSRRRHTRFSRDWSSDVCSSDLEASGRPAGDSVPLDREAPPLELSGECPDELVASTRGRRLVLVEDRQVGPPAARREPVEAHADRADGVAP